MTNPGEADFVSEKMKATNTILSILVIVVLDETEAKHVLARLGTVMKMSVPFA